MAVIVKMDTGDTYLLDRRLNCIEVAGTINDARGKGKLIDFQNDETPSRVVYIDPDHVLSVKNDGY